jgi:hypothetical protein
LEIVADVGHDEMQHEGTFGTERKAGCDGRQDDGNRESGQQDRTQAA